jgi:hypothetical protein
MKSPTGIKMHNKNKISGNPSLPPIMMGLDDNPLYGGLQNFQVAGFSGGFLSLRLGKGMLLLY